MALIMIPSRKSKQMFGFCRRCLSIYYQMTPEELYDYPTKFADRFMKARASGDKLVPKNTNKGNRNVDGDNLIKLLPREISDSSVEVILPFSRDASLREKYLTFFNSLRFGKLLGDMDLVAACVGLRHYCGPCPGYMFVTASAESIKLHKSFIPANNDIHIKGSVKWTGNSSIDVSITVDEKVDDSYVRLVDASFIMVARTFNGSSCHVNPLNLANAAQEKQFKQGEQRKLERQRKLKYSLLKNAPTEDERTLIHSIYLDTLDQQQFSFKARRKPDHSIWMHDAGLKSVKICHPQDKNTMNVMFGGFLMKEAFELAWANAYMHCQSQPFLAKADDMLFLNPVEIGSLLFFSSQIVYTEGRYLLVRVHAHVTDPRNGKKSITGVYHFHFNSKDSFAAVVPKSYGEFMLYLEGKRYASAALSSDEGDI